MLQESPLLSGWVPYPMEIWYSQHGLKWQKTAKIGRNGPHSRSHISMVLASSNVTKIARDTWDVGPDTCPMSTLDLASNHFSSGRKNGTPKMAGGSVPHIEPPMAPPSQGEDTRGYTLFAADLCPLSKSVLTLKNGRIQPGGEY